MSLPVHSTDDIKRNFRPRGGYDCILMQPQADGVAVRIEGTIVARSRSSLRAPLAQRSCVMFSASAGEVRLDGVRAPPIAFCAMNSDFEIQLGTGGNPLRISISGQDVALFDMAKGKLQEQCVIGDAPEHLQEFVRTHRTGSMGDGSFSSSAVIEFTECMLDIGAIVTAVGELRRAATGELQLWPLNASVIASDRSSSGSEYLSGDAESHEQRTPGRTRAAAPAASTGFTSWECAGTGSSQLSKVMISDDAEIMHGNDFSNTTVELLCGTAGRSRTSSCSSPQLRSSVPGTPPPIHV